MNYKVHKLSKIHFKKNVREVTLEQSDRQGFRYAFYLEFPCGKIVKIKYSYNLSSSFHCQENGFYKATFYLKSNSEILVEYRYFVLSEGGLQEVKSELVADHPGYKIEHFSQGSNKTVVVYQERDTFYQHLSFQNFKSLMSDRLQGNDVWCYGSSLGGWCALYYAGAIEANVIAASPRQPIHPDFLARQKKKKKSVYAYQHHEIYENPLSNKKIYVVVDPHEVLDIFSIDNLVIDAYPDLKLVEVEFGGHESLFYLSETRQLNYVISSLFNNLVPVVKSCPDSFWYGFNKARYYARKGDPLKALNLVDAEISRGAEGKVLKRLKLLRDSCILKI